MVLSDARWCQVIRGGAKLNYVMVVGAVLLSGDVRC